MNFAASILALQLATAQPVDIPEDWVVPPPPSRKEINNAVRDVIAEEIVIGQGVGIGQGGGADKRSRAELALVRHTDQLVSVCRH